MARVFKSSITPAIMKAAEQVLRSIHQQLPRLNGGWLSPEQWREYSQIVRSELSRLGLDVSLFPDKDLRATQIGLSVVWGTYYKPRGLSFGQDYGR